MEGGGPIPIEHYLGRLSEEFGGALPSEIIREMQRLPVGFLEQLLEYRNYAAAVRANADDEKGWQSSPMRILAKQIQHALAGEARAAQ